MLDVLPGPHQPGLLELRWALLAGAALLLQLHNRHAKQRLARCEDSCRSPARVGWDGHGTQWPSTPCSDGVQQARRSCPVQLVALRPPGYKPTPW
jgi:hypothetical protein